MEAVAVTNLILYLVASSVAVFKGLDLRRWVSWLFALYGFASGLLLGLTYGGLGAGLEGGALFAFAVMFGGATTRWHRQRFK